jgi:hypothetical protein
MYLFLFAWLIEKLELYFFQIVYLEGTNFKWVPEKHDRILWMGYEAVISKFLIRNKEIVKIVKIFIFFKLTMSVTSFL